MTQLTDDEAAERIEAVLKAAGIKATIFSYLQVEAGCSCRGVFEVEFPDGAKHESNSVYIECDGISHQRG